jgi:hypothetical protein
VTTQRYGRGTFPSYLAKPSKLKEEGHQPAVCLARHLRGGGLTLLHRDGIGKAALQFHDVD